MIDKRVASAALALADIPDGATVMIGGFGTAGLPDELTDALIVQGARDLTIINNNAGNGEQGIAALLAAGRVRKVICSFPRQADSHHFDRLYRAGQVEPTNAPSIATLVGAKGARRSRTSAISFCRFGVRTSSASMFRASWPGLSMW